MKIHTTKKSTHNTSEHIPTNIGGRANIAYSAALLPGSSPGAGNVNAKYIKSAVDKTASTATVPNTIQTTPNRIRPIPTPIAASKMTKLSIVRNDFIGCLLQMLSPTLKKHNVEAPLPPL